ncbi:hypothetical protein SKAU_G00105060 [Synaphobranchus kaupii]|uniref:Uncharacterized protein n=1 Tax=Synaphobranchus kaupii TaxID=118154 RepID=A0A9Q1FZ43_SYNKA|nr:hypothetical protein SKAU_G00105060 [Synaphobranchus kaupii]
MALRLWLRLWLAGVLWRGGRGKAWQSPHPGRFLPPDALAFSSAVTFLLSLRGRAGLDRLPPSLSPRAVTAGPVSLGSTGARLCLPSPPFPISHLGWATLLARFNIGKLSAARETENAFSTRSVLKSRAVREFRFRRGLTEPIVFGPEQRIPTRIQTWKGGFRKRQAQAFLRRPARGRGSAARKRATNGETRSTENGKAELNPRSPLSRTFSQSEGISL